MAVLLWWTGCSALAVWGPWGQSAACRTMQLSAALLFAVLLVTAAPRRLSARVAVYVSALLANFAAPMFAAVGLATSGHRSVIVDTAMGLAAKAACAVLAVATFLLVRAWVGEGDRWRQVPRRQPLECRALIGTGCAAALIYVTALLLADWGRVFAGGLIGVGHAVYPSAGGDFTAWTLRTAYSALAGAVEEPVFVGLLVLLWPRLRLRTVIPLALGGGVARSVIHFYYAAGDVHFWRALVLTMVWCVLWSSMALILVYKTRSLWPVVVGHGLTNALQMCAAAFGGSYHGLTPLQGVAALSPMLAVLVLIAGSGWRPRPPAAAGHECG